jgi:two-component system sensor histidine kinase TctE
VLFIVNTVSLYRQALAAVNTAYDRTLLASAKSIGEQLDVTGYDEQASCARSCPIRAGSLRGRQPEPLFYRVSSLNGEWSRALRELPFWRGAFR